MRFVFINLCFICYLFLCAGVIKTEHYLFRVCFDFNPS